MKRALQFVFGLFLSQVVLAGPTNPPITKIVYQFIDISDTSPSRYVSKPRTIYLGGETYARMEQPPDPNDLNIISMPDVWEIKLFDRRGRHTIADGPPVVHHCIFNSGPVEECIAYGKEIEFFRGHKAVSLGIRELDNNRCTAAELKHENKRMVLYTIVDTNTPFQLEFYEDAKALGAVRYISYQTGLPFDASLFRPPVGISITEANHK